MNGLTDRRDEANSHFYLLHKNKKKNKNNEDNGRTKELKPRNVANKKTP